MIRALIILCSSLVAFLGASSAEAQSCAYNANGEVVINSMTMNTSESNIDKFCRFTADQLNMKIYGLYLCRNNPQPSTYQEECEEVFFDPAGKVANIELNTANSLGLADLSIPTGEYLYAAFLADKALGATFTVNFDNDVQGSSGVGNVCWSNGNESRISYPNGDISSFSVDCGTAAQASPTPSYFHYSFFYIGSNGSFTNKQEGIPLGIPRSAFLLKNLTELGDIVPGAPYDTNAVVSNVRYILGVQKLPTPQLVSESTQNVDIGFAIQNTFMHKLSANSRYLSGGASACGGSAAAWALNGPAAQFTPHGTTGAVGCFVGSRPVTFSFRFEVQ